MLSRKTTNSLIPVRLGSLLIASNLLRPESVANALMITRQTGRKLGEFLVSQKLISQADLASALELQRLIKDGSITVEMGARALKQAHNDNNPLRTALTEMGWTDKDSVRTHDLASILLAAECLKKEQMQQSSWNSANNMLPLGRNLVLNGSITPSILGAALNALILIRDKRIGFETAVIGLKKCVRTKCTLEESLDLELPVSANHVRIGELLSSAGLLSESDAMNAVEAGLLNQRSIGQVLLESRMVSTLVLDAALKLQKLIEGSKLTRTQASELLRQVASRQINLDVFMSEMFHLKTRVLELLTDSGLIEDNEVSIALEACPQQENDIIRALFMSGALSQEMFRASVRCVYAIDEGSLTKEAAMAHLRQHFEPSHSINTHNQNNAIDKLHDHEQEQVLRSA